jgi:dihydroxy-acid dehydratase
VGVANTWIEIGPCNYHLRRLAAKVKEGIRAAGGTPMEFNTVSISDGISMGTEGMKASLISREVIAAPLDWWHAAITLMRWCVFLVATRPTRA